jgi:hypothetical protein
LTVIKSTISALLAFTLLADNLGNTKAHSLCRNKYLKHLSSTSLKFGKFNIIFFPENFCKFSDISRQIGHFKSFIQSKFKVTSSFSFVHLNFANSFATSGVIGQFMVSSFHLKLSTIYLASSYVISLVTLLNFSKFFQNSLFNDFNFSTLKEYLGSLSCDFCGSCCPCCSLSHVDVACTGSDFHFCSQTASPEESFCLPINSKYFFNNFGPGTQSTLSQFSL